MTTSRLQAAAILVTLAGTLSAAAQTEAQIKGITVPEIAGLLKEKAQRTEWKRKLDSQLVYLLQQDQSGHASLAAPSLQAPKLTDIDGRIIVDIQGEMDETFKSAVNAVGGKILYQSPGNIRVEIAPEHIRPLAEIPTVSWIQPQLQGIAHQVTSVIDREGVIAHAADTVQDIHHLGILGEGVTVGILSDSIDDGQHSLQKAFDAGIIDPAHLMVLDGQAGVGKGEGLAMAEIVHAIAPKARIIFATADGGKNGGPSLMADNIRRLKDKGCNIIVDDYTYPQESPFEVSTKSLAGAIGKAVEDVAAAGVLYFSVARNSGNQNHKTSGTWEGDFNDGGPVGNKLGGIASSGHFNKFEFGVTLNTADDAGTNARRVDLFWSDPLGKSSNSYDLFVVDRHGHVVKSSTNTQDGRQDPYQSIPILFNGQSIVVVRAAGAQSRFIHLDIGDGALRHSTNGSVRGHNAVSSSNALTVAATSVPPSGVFSLGPGDSVESFSSDGPRRIFYDSNGNALTPNNLSSTGGILLHKPDITAADAVSTSLAAPTLSRFKGTSAAAPHAAGIAALLMSCKPTPSPAAIRNALQSTAQPIEGDQQNDTAGYGVIMADAAAAQLCHVPTP